MEKRVLEYEKYIDEKFKSAKHSADKEKLWVYHREMVADFQHERLIHLLIMLFFICLTLGLWGVSYYYLSLVSISSAIIDWLTISPLLLATLIITILSIAYVKHYYFLENHIQRLYDFSRKFTEKDT